MPSSSSPGPFAVYTGMPIAAAAPPIRSLHSLERDLGTNLGLPVPPDGPPVEIYILRDRDAFTHFLTFYYPELPPRRAFFLAQGPRRVTATRAGSQPWPETTTSCSSSTR